MSDSRSCTCHPDEAPKPCQRHFGLSECLMAAEIDRLRSDLSAAEGVISRLNSGAELQTLMAENERLREVLKRALEEDADGHVKWQTRKDARAALGDRT